MNRAAKQLIRNSGASTPAEASKALKYPPPIPGLLSPQDLRDILFALEAPRREANAAVWQARRRVKAKRIVRKALEEMLAAADVGGPVFDPPDPEADGKEEA